MSIEIEPNEIAKTDTNLASCIVKTVDATGTNRKYRVGLNPTGGIDGEPIQEGSRIDENAPNEPAGGGVPNRVFEATREYFEKQGYKVY